MKPILAKAHKELRSLFRAFLYFSFCFGVILILKTLLLAEYHIEYHGLSLVFIAALISAKVTLIFEHLPISRMLQRRMIALDLAVRTALYVIGAVLLLFAEKAFETRHEYGGFSSAFVMIVEREDMDELWATLLCAALAFLSYNLLVVLSPWLPGGGLMNFLFATRGRDLVGKNSC